MKKIGLVLGVLVVLVLLSGIAFADPLISNANFNKYNNWVSTGVLTKCSNCGSQQVVYNERSNNDCKEGHSHAANDFTTGEKGKTYSQNCVCAECNKKCGTGHETWCSSYQKPKAKPDIASGILALNINTVLGASCIEKDLQCTLNGTPCCAPYSCKGKFPNTYCK